MSRKIQKCETRYRSVGNTTLVEHENTFKNTASVSGLSSSSTVPVESFMKKDFDGPKFTTKTKSQISFLQTEIEKASFAIRLVHGEDDRKAILQTIYPYNIICLLSINSRYHREPLRGTGFFISRRCVLTAGHCIYDNETWMDSVTVIPGALGDLAPYGHMTTSRFRSIEGWTKDRNSNFDYGAILLDNDNLYNQLNAHMGFRISERMVNVEISGYPLDKEKIPHMARGKISFRSTYRFFYDIDTEGGNSGSPIFHYDESDLRAVGIHTGGDNPENYGIRFRSELMDRLNEWILL